MIKVALHHLGGLLQFPSHIGPQNDEYDGLSTPSRV
jgi:hypothetical protein